MIPKVTQDGPNIVARYWCSNCGQSLPTSTFSGQEIRWKFCPECGRPIEWDRAVPVKWTPLDCDTCGRPIIREMDGHMIDTGGYVGTSTCRTCMTEHCRSTNCLGCKRGNYPDCRWLYLKGKYFPVTVFERHGDDDYSMWTTELPAALIQTMENNTMAAEGELQEVVAQLPDLSDCESRRRPILFYHGGCYHLFSHGACEYILEAHRNDGGSVRGTLADIMADVLEQEKPLCTGGMRQ